MFPLKSTRAREERRSEYDENQRGQRKEKKERERERVKEKKMERALFGRATVKMRMHKCGNNNEPEI